MFELFKSHKPKPAKGQAEETGPKPDGQDAVTTAGDSDAKTKDEVPAQPDEIGGPKGKEPTRYGDWERKGICYDF